MMRTEAVLRVSMASAVSEVERLRFSEADPRFIFIYKYLFDCYGHTKLDEAAWASTLECVFESVEFKMVEGESLLMAKCSFAHSTLTFVLLELDIVKSGYVLAHFEFHS